jgi:hypothetical protein
MDDGTMMRSPLHERDTFGGLFSDGKAWAAARCRLFAETCIDKR